MRRNARFLVYFPKPVDLADLVQTVANATCKTFILPSNITGKIAIIGPDNGKGEVDAEQFYSAFLAALDANNFTVYPHGPFLKITEKRNAKFSAIPTLSAEDNTFTTNEAMITKIFKLRYADIDPVKTAISGLINTGQGAEITPVPPDTLIITEVADNLHRLEGIIQQLDTRSSTDEVRVIQLRYAVATEVAGTIQKIFEQKGNKPVRANTHRATSGPHARREGQPPPPGGARAVTPGRSPSRRSSPTIARTS